jgi:hypothetical protein
MAGLAPRRPSGRLFIDKVGELPPDAQRASRKRLALSARNAVNRDQLAALNFDQTLATSSGRG